ncbi:MAG: copper oxidase [Planctomycetota bacterium]|nr:copper oxidase [Planctomycetota bacterium]
MDASRRKFFTTSVGAAAIVPALPALLAARGPAARAVRAANAPALPPGLPGRDYRPVVTPNSIALPFRIVDGVKVFHLVAAPVEHEFAPGLAATCWGYNGRVHGPTIEAVEGERVRIYVTNRLDVATTTHWHGLVVPNGMDGVGGLHQRAIEPNETFRYEFTLRGHGTYMYHSHHDEMTQMALGLMGLFVVHPRDPEPEPPARDYAILLSEWKIEPGARRPDPNEMMDFNVLTMNAKIHPATQNLVAKLGERVRIRIGNLSAMSHHPIHLHGHSFRVSATDGGPVPESSGWPETTVLVPTGSTRTIEFTADEPGDWPLHCHMTHHVMTQMGHGVPNTVGVDLAHFDEALYAHVPAYTTMGEEMGGDGDHDALVPKNSLSMMGSRGPFGQMTMSGMFTILKVRDAIEEGVEPGWYTHPPGTQAAPATKEEIERDGIEAG